ncbi:hypothetical protein EMCRGX_G023254 [Ephydatia muelleri]
MLRSNRIVARLAPLRTQFSFVRRIQALRTPEPTNANGSVFSVKAVEELLEANKCNYSVGHASYVVQCPLCDGGGDGKKDIYVNKTTGNVVCKPCRVKASWSEFSQWLKLKNTGALPVIPQKQNPVPSLTEPSWRTTKSWADSPRDVIDRVNSAFGIELLNPAFLAKYSVHTGKAKFPTLSGTTAELPCVVFPWFEEREDKAPFRIKMETVVDRSDRQVVLEPKDGSYGLFGWNTVPAGAKEIVITRGEFDAIAVNQSTGIPAVALPSGTFLPPEVLPQLEPFERIVVWKLNMERCFLVCSQDGLPKVHTPLDALKKGVDLRLVIDSAKPIKHKKIVTFNQLRDEVYGELSNSNQVAGVKWHRFPKLNQILKGHRPGELTVFTGPTGSGKTTFISELSLDLAMQGVTTLWGSFEIKNVRLAKTMMYQLSGMRLEKQLEQYGYWADRLEQLPLYFMGFYGPVDLQNVIETMSHSAYVHDIQHVIVDNLQFMTGATHNMSDKYSLQSQAIAAFRMFASEKNVHVTVVIHPRKEEESNALTTASIFGTAKVSQEADNIMILQAPDKNNKFLQVTKNRFDGDTGVVPLSFDRESLTLSGHFANKEVHSDREEDLFVPLFEEGRSSSQVFKASSVPISKYQIRTSLSRPTNTSAVTTQPLTPIIPSPTYTAPVTVATPSITIPTVATPPVTTSIVTTPPVTSPLPGHQSSLHHGFKLSFVKQPATASPVAKQPAPSVGGPVAKVPNGPIPLQGAPSTATSLRRQTRAQGGFSQPFGKPLSPTASRQLKPLQGAPIVPSSSPLKPSASGVAIASTLKHDQTPSSKRQSDPKKDVAPRVQQAKQ